MTALQAWWRTANDKTRQRVFIGILAAAVLLVYTNTLRNSFVLDDELYIQRNPQVTTPTLKNLLASNGATDVFRPLTFATFAVNWWVGPDRPFGFHLVNLFLHAAVTCLLFLLLQNLLAASPQGTTTASVAALLFAVHPIHTEAVANVTGRSELLAAGFLFAAWLLYLRNREIAAAACFALALLSKESAAVFLPLLLVGDYARGKFKSYSRYAWIASITLLYLGVLWKLQGSHFGTSSISQMDNPLASVPATWRILNAFHVAWKYVALQIFPATLSCDYSFNQIPVYFDLLHTLPWAAATLAAVAAWIWALRKQAGGWVLAGGIYLAGFSITANILLPLGTIMGERLAYLPSAGFCLLAALAWNWLRAHQRTLAFAALGLAVAALGARTVARNRDWKDTLSLYTSAVRAAPRSAKMHANLGRTYLDLGDSALARRELDSALQIYPDYPDALESYGLLESRAGNYQAAGRMLESAFYRSARDNPNYDYMAVNLAALYIQTGHLDGALQLLDREIAEAPDYGRAWSNRAVIHFRRGQLAAARSDAEAALRLEPANPQARNLLYLLNSPPAAATPR